MGHLGLGELILLLIVALLVFGSSKLPALGDALGKAIHNVRRGLRGRDDAPKDQPR